ncbi:MAG: transposase [Patescibacteria group bacterium]
MTLRKIYLQEQCYFLTTNVLNKLWVFGHFKNTIYVPAIQLCDVIINDLNFYRQKFQFQLHGYVIMPNHLHLILTIGSIGNVSEIMRDFKGHTSYEINKLLKNKSGFWQEDFYEHTIRNEQDFAEKMNYIHNNPVKSNFVKNPADFKYSSFRNYYLNDDSVIKIDKIVK